MSFVKPNRDDCQAFCEVESGVASSEISLLFNGIPLLDLKKSLKDYGVKDGDMVMMDQIRRRPPAPAPAPTAAAGGMNWDFSRIQIPGAVAGAGAGAGAGPSRAAPAPSRPDSEDPAYIREMLLANPDQLAMLKQNNTIYR